MLNLGGAELIGNASMANNYLSNNADRFSSSKFKEQFMSFKEGKNEKEERVSAKSSYYLPAESSDYLHKLNNKKRKDPEELDNIDLQQNLPFSSEREQTKGEVIQLEVNNQFVLNVFDRQVTTDIQRILNDNPSDNLSENPSILSTQPFLGRNQFADIKTEDDSILDVKDTNLTLIENSNFMDKSLAEDISNIDQVVVAENIIEENEKIIDFLSKNIEFTANETKIDNFRKNLQQENLSKIEVLDNIKQENDAILNQAISKSELDPNKNWQSSSMGEYLSKNEVSNNSQSGKSVFEDEISNFEELSNQFNKEEITNSQGNLLLSSNQDTKIHQSVNLEKNNNFVQNKDEFIARFNEMNTHIKIDKVTSTGDNYIIVKMHPEHLGEVKFTLNIRDDLPAKMQITVDSKEALVVMEKYIQDLRDNLLKIGIETEHSTDFNLSKDNGNNNENGAKYYAKDIESLTQKYLLNQNEKEKDIPYKYNYMGIEHRKINIVV